MADSLIWLAALGAIGGVALLRFGWGQARRSIPLNAGGWLLIAFAAIVGWAGAGMWGASVAALAGMGAAGVLLGVAAAKAPKGKAAASNRRVKLLPERGEKLRIGGRLLTFVLAAPLAMALAVGLGVALRGLAMGFGASEANANTLGLFFPPIAWGLIAFVLLIQGRRRMQALVVLICAVPVVPVIAGALL